MGGSDCVRRVLAHLSRLSWVVFLVVCTAQEARAIPRCGADPHQSADCTSACTSGFNAFFDTNSAAAAGTGGFYNLDQSPKLGSYAGGLCWDYSITTSCNTGTLSPGGYKSFNVHVHGVNGLGNQTTISSPAMYLGCASSPPTPPAGNCGLPSGVLIGHINTRTHGESASQTRCLDSCLVEPREVLSWENRQYIEYAIYTTGQSCSPGIYGNGGYPSGSNSGGTPILITGHEPNGGCSDTFCAQEGATGVLLSDGSSISWSTLAAAGCFETSTGSVVCRDDYSGPATPDSGTAGNPASYDDSAVYYPGSNGLPGTNPVQVNYYSPTTAAGSTNYGSVGSSGGATGGTTSGTTSGSTTGTTGTSGTTTGTTSGGDTGTTTGGTTGGTSGDGSGGSGGSGDGDGSGSIAGGLDCSAEPACDGDPIQCYHARALWDNACAIQTSSAAQILAETERFTDATPDDGTILSTVTHDVGQLVIPYQPGACPPDLPISLPEPYNVTVTVPLSQMCTLFAVLGAFIHLGAAWLALRILGS